MTATVAAPAFPSFSGAVEFSPGFRPRPVIRHVLFDFDGTLSLIREGWIEVMAGMFLEMIPAREGESEEDRRGMVLSDIADLTGKQTIYQMFQLEARIKERGGKPRDALWYKHEYLRRLDERIRGRVAGLATGALSPEQFLVHGSRALLDELARRGLTLYLASGTDEPYVKREAELLDVARYFGPRVYGALDDYKRMSKKLVIERILRENRVDGATLLAFGDGYVEIENTKEVGGLAVAVASDEAHNGSGKMDEWKRRRLVGVGADVVIPDFRDAPALLTLLLDA